MSSDNDLESLTERLADTTVAVDELTELVSFSGRGLKLDKAEDAKEVVEAMEKCPRLRVLRLDGNTVGVEAAEAIAKSLSSKSMFQRALWSDMFTGRLRSEIPPALNSLGGAIEQAGAGLVELDLSDNAFGPDGVQAVSKLLRSSSGYTLEVLKFNNNGLGIGGGKILSQALIECHRKSTEAGKPLKLKTFIAGRNRLENDGAKALAQAFKTIGTLEEISMPQNGIYHVGIAALCDAFTANCRLRVLNMNDNTYTEKGAAHLAKALPAMQKLETLNLGDCLLKTRGATVLADALGPGHHELRELVLTFNEIDQRGAIAVAEAMEKKTKLERLDLNGNQLGEDGIEILQGTLEAIDKIEVLGSLSDDEGEPDEEDEEDEEEDEEEEEEEEENNSLYSPERRAELMNLLRSYASRDDGEDDDDDDDNDDECPAVEELSTDCEIARRMGAPPHVQQFFGDICRRHEVCYTCGSQAGISARECDRGFLGEAEEMCSGEDEEACILDAGKMLVAVVRHEYLPGNGPATCRRKCVYDYIVGEDANDIDKK